MLSSFVLCALSLHGIMRSATAFPILNAASVTSSGDSQGQPLLARRENSGLDGAYSSQVARRAIDQGLLVDHSKRALTTRDDTNDFETHKGEDGKTESQPDDDQKQATAVNKRRHLEDASQKTQGNGSGKGGQPGGNQHHRRHPDAGPKNSGDGSQTPPAQSGGKEHHKRQTGDDPAAKSDGQTSDKEAAQGADEKTGQDADGASKSDSESPSQIAPQKADGQSGSMVDIKIGKRDGSGGDNGKPNSKPQDGGNGQAGKDAGHGGAKGGNPKGTNQSPPQKQNGKPGEKGSILIKRDGDQGNNPPGGLDNNGPHKRQVSDAEKADGDDQAQAQNSSQADEQAVQEQRQKPHDG